MPAKVLLIGIGMGPGHVTPEAATAIGACDVLFVVDKQERAGGLATVRRRVCEAYGRAGLRVVAIPDAERDRAPADYAGEVERWHRRRVEAWERAFAEHLTETGTGGFLVWGDPALYDSTIRLLDQVREGGRVAFGVDVIPGVSSVSVLAARHRIPLNEIGSPVLITTGRRLLQDSADHDTLVVMLDGGAAWTELDTNVWEIWWGAYLGLAEEMLIAGPLEEVGEQIAGAKRRARDSHGWIMDVYLLRRRRHSGGE